MRKTTTTCIIVCACLQAAGALSADEIRHYEENGITYRETRRVIRRPVTRTEWKDQQQTVYRQEWKADTCNTYRTCRTPVTEFRWDSRLHERWNPFVVPYYTHHLVPVTRWDTRVETVQVPRWRAEWKPESRTVRVPVTTHQMAEEEVITRVAVGGSPGTRNSTQIANRPDRAPVAGRASSTVPSYGGVVLPADPPRHATGWRSRGTAVR